MLGKLQSNLLTYLFKDWASNETDEETLQIAKQMIEQRQGKVLGIGNTGRTVVNVFRNVE
jgi:hypothetical protein